MLVETWGYAMSHEIGYGPRGRSRVSVTYEPNARAALKTVLALSASDEEIKYIKAPARYEIGLGELRLLAERELSEPRDG